MVDEVVDNLLHHILWRCEDALFEVLLGPQLLAHSSHQGLVVDALALATNRFEDCLLELKTRLDDELDIVGPHGCGRCAT